MIEESIFLHICCAIFIYGASVAHKMNEEGQSFYEAKANSLFPAFMGLFLGGITIFVCLFLYDFYTNGLKFTNKD